MAKTFEINVNSFNAAMRELAQRTGLDIMTVLKSEGAAIARKAAATTVKAKAKAIEESKTKWYSGGKYKVGNDVVIADKWYIYNGHISGKQIVFDLENLARYHITTQNWILSRIGSARQTFKSNVKKLVAKQKKKAGLARQSFDLMTQELGGTPAAVNMKARALTSSGQEYIPYENSRIRETTKQILTLINTSPSANTSNAKGGVAMQKALNGRTGFYYRNVKTGVFNDMKQVQAKYPGLKIAA